MIDHHDHMHKVIVTGLPAHPGKSKLIICFGITMQVYLNVGTYKITTPWQPNPVAHSIIEAHGGGGGGGGGGGWWC